MASLLDLTDDLQESRLAAGTTVCAQGDQGGPLWVLVSGSLSVIKDGVQVSLIDQPGAVIGEISVLLGTPITASVVAASDAVVRLAPDGTAFLEANPAALTFLATGLARRLQAATTYLADLTNQYGDSPGLAMVGDVLGQLTTQQRPPARPGSARDPDPEY
jgi:CRP-like cAMP-binding protein